MITITLLNNGKDRYTMSSNSFYLGRKYDDNAQEYQVIFPQEEIDAGHTCKMIVTACNGSIPVDTIPMASGVTKLVRSNLSQYDRIEIGFTFEGPNNYRKNSEIRYFFFYDAQMPDGFIPATPEINTIVDEAFCGVQWKDGVDNTLQFTNLAGQVKDEINLGEFVQEQSDLAETDDTKETFVKNKSTKYLVNEGEDGSSSYATVQYVNDEDDSLQSQIDVVNDNITNLSEGLQEAEQTIQEHTNDIDQLNNDVADLENEVADALEDISDIQLAIDKNVVSGIDVSTNVDNVSINSNIVNIKTGTTSTDADAIPLANDTTAGLISHSDYQQIRQNTEDIAALKGQTIRIAYSIKTNPTPQEIQQFVTDAGYTQDQWPQIAVVVTGTNYVWRYYENDGWTQQTDVVSIFTNDTAGIIKGSTANGKIYAETDGTGSVNGWDAQNNRITNLENNKADKSELDNYVPITRTINNKALSSNISLDANDVNALPSDTTYVTSVNGQSGVVTGLQNEITSNNKLSSDLVDDTSATNKFVTTTEKNIWNGKQDTQDNNLTTTSKQIVLAINEVNSIAKGAQQAISYGNYQTMVTAFNAIAADVYNVGQNVMIVTLEVPDLWISAIETTSVPYTYTTDEAITTALQTDGYIQVGYYKLSALETTKVDLTEYIKNTDYASSSNAGVFKKSSTYNTDVNSNGVLTGVVNTYSDYQSKDNAAFIAKGTLENVITGKQLVNSTDLATKSGKTTVYWLL